MTNNENNNVCLGQLIYSLTEELDHARRHCRSYDNVSQDDYLASLEREINYFRTMLNCQKYDSHA